MKSLLFASALLLAVSTADGLQTTSKKPYTVESAFPKAWVSLFSPPYQGCPEIMMSIGCTTDNTCYIPGVSQSGGGGGGGGGPSFVQVNYNGANCTGEGEQHTFQAGSCLPLQGGGSAVAMCTKTQLQQTVYNSSSSCSGPSQTDSMPLDQCLKTKQGTYFKNLCPGGPTPTQPPTKKGKAVEFQAGEAIGSTVGSSNAAMGVYKFDGKVNGNFTALNKINSPEFNFELFAAVSGTATNPKGAVGGVSLDNGLLYFVNDTTLAPANITISEEQALSVDKTGNQVLAFDGFATTWPLIGLYSENAGKDYRGFSIDAHPINKTCTQPLWQSIAADGVWIFAAGSQPPSKSSGGGGNSKTKSKVLKIVNDRVAYVKPGATKAQVEAMGFTISEHNPLVATRSLRELQKTRREAEAEKHHHNDGPICPYSAATFVTTDAGKTWATHDFNTTYWSPDAIACSDAKTCLMVGSGMGQFPGSRIMKTTDGSKTWKEVLFLPSEGGEEIWSLSALAYNPTSNGMEAWVGGGVENPAGNKAVFFYTKDGGETWHKSSEINFVEMIMDMDFTAEGNGFAVGMTQFQDTTVLRYTSDGFPQTPVPVWNGNFTQIQCTDNKCSVNCTSLSLPQGTCLKLNGNGPFGQPPSAIAKCDMADNVLIQDIYILDDKCSGPAQAQPQALNTCIDQGQGQGSFKTICGPVSRGEAPAAPATAQFKTLAKRPRRI